jgi:hypothetical protein
MNCRINELRDLTKAEVKEKCAALGVQIVNNKEVMLYAIVQKEEENWKEGQQCEGKEC